MSDPTQAEPNLREPPTDAPTDPPLAPVPDAPAERGTLQPSEHLSKDGENALPVDWKALVDRALVFLSTANNETLGACLAGLGVGTYLILGRVGLILIGVVGGIALHATWENHMHGEAGHEKSPDARRRELGVDIAHRVLSWREKRGQDASKDQHDDADLSVKLCSGQQLDFSDFRPETAAALTELTDAVIRDYVKWWYNPIIPAEALFPNSCRQTLIAFLTSMSSHLSRKRPADSFVDFVTKSSSFMIIFFSELSNAIMANPGETAPEAVDLYVKMKRDSTLATILDSDFQSKQLASVAEDILQNYLEPKTYNCKPAREFLNQILSKVVLEMIVATCSKPEWINGWMVYLLEDGEPELLEAIDAGVEASPLGTATDSIQRRENSEAAKKHKRVVSRAQQAMDEAMQEAQRLNEMIAEEDARKVKEQNASNSSLTDDQSESTTQGIVTPTSSQSENLAESDMSAFGITNMTSHAPSDSRAAPFAKENTPPPKEAFTSFDQLVPNAPPTALMDDPPPAPPPLTLHNSKMTIFDDSMPGEKGVIRNKPTVEYLIQIEPSLQYYKGWMSAKKYTDFETLHEVLRRIASITGSSGFVEAHKELPTWKNHTKASLRGELERYLNDAVQYRPLAESEGMKRFLDKDIGSGKSPGASGLWPGQAFETMGKGMIDVLSQAPKGVAGGGKALFGGVTGVLGSVGTPFGAKNGKKRGDSTSNSPSVSRTSTSLSQSTPITNRHGRAESTVSELPTLPTHIRSESTMSFATKRTSTESLRNPNSPIVDQQPQREAPMERRPSYNPDGDGKRSGPSSLFGGSRSASRAPSVRESMDLSPTMGGDQILNLPPMPSEITDDYTDPAHSRHPSRASTTSSIPFTTDVPPVPPLPRRPSAISVTSSNVVPTATAASSPESKSKKPKSAHAPLSESETTVLIELFFATVNELFTLSSAWGLRRTLLNAAKTFLLRPGNPQLTSIQTLMQSTVLDANTSDAGLAFHIKKIRANALPTEPELAAWKAETEKKGWVNGEMSDKEKEELRVRARRVLIERGMPQALTSVMGQAASGEALGRVFDALQQPSVARGVIFGLMLQALKGITQ